MNLLLQVLSYTLFSFETPFKIVPKLSQDIPVI